MAVLGADPVELRGGAKQVRTSQRRISEVGKKLGARVRASSWTGPDAEAFKARWRTHESKLASTAALLGEAADSLEKNALEQLDASSARMSGMGSGGLQPGRDPDSPLLEDMPTRTETYWVNAQFAAMFGLDGEARVSIEYLPDGTAVVWLEGLSGLSVEGGIGFHGGADGAGIGLQASAFGRASEASRLGWRMDGEDVEGFIAAAVASHAVERASGDAFIPDSFDLSDLPLVGAVLPGFVKEATLESVLNPLGKALSDWFDTTGISAGDPDHRERAVGLAFGGGLDADLGLTLAGAGVVGGLSAGLRSSPGGLSLRVSGSATSRAEVAGRGYERSVDKAVEVSLDEEGPAHLMVTTTTRHADTQMLSVETYEVTRRAREQLIEAVADGDLRGAGEDLAGIADSLGHPLDSATVHGEVDRDAIDDIGGEVSVGPKGEMRGGAGREVVRYDR